GRGVGRDIERKRGRVLNLEGRFRAGRADAGDSGRDSAGVLNDESQIGTLANLRRGENDVTRGNDRREIRAAAEGVDQMRSRAHSLENERVGSDAKKTGRHADLRGRESQLKQNGAAGIDRGRKTGQASELKRLVRGRYGVNSSSSIAGVGHAHEEAGGAANVGGWKDNGLVRGERRGYRPLYQCIGERGCSGGRLREGGQRREKCDGQQCKAEFPLHLLGPPAGIMYTAASAFALSTRRGSSGPRAAFSRKTEFPPSGCTDEGGLSSGSSARRLPVPISYSRTRRAERLTV